MPRVRVNRKSALFDGGFPYSATVSPGPLLFTAGIAPLDADGEIWAPGDVVEQTRRCLANLTTVLDEQHADPADIVKLTVYVAERLQADLTVAWQEVVEMFGDRLPPVMMMGVTVLPYDGQLVEVEAIASVPPTPSFGIR